MAPRRSDRHAAAPAAPAPARDAPSSGDAVYINADEIPPAAWRRLNLTPRTGWVVGRVAEPVGDAAEPLDSLAMLEVLLKVDVADDGVKLSLGCRCRRRRRWTRGGATSPTTWRPTWRRSSCATARATTRASHASSTRSTQLGTGARRV
jgi:hypothetical protein